MEDQDKKIQSTCERIVRNDLYCNLSHIVCRMIELEPDQWLDSEGICGKPDEDEGYEDEYREPYEHWSVSEWLAGKLEEQGCLIERDFYGHSVWGRETTGQSVSMDSCMIAIAKAICQPEVDNA